MGRVVLNHSTHIDGLIRVLRKLALIDGIKTITPAVITKAKSNCNKLEIRITRRKIGGYKMIARKGSLAQEVFINTTLEESVITATLQGMIRESK